MYSLLESNGLQLVYNIVISNTALREELEAQVDMLLPSFRTKGFRKGAAPRDLVKQQKWSTILQKALSKLLDLAVEKIVRDNQYTLVCLPSFAFEKDVDYDKDITVKTWLELSPKIPEIDYAKIALELPTVKVRPIDLEREIDSIVNAYTSIDPYGDKMHPSVPGDVVEIIVTGKVDKVALKDYQKKRQLVLMGESDAFPDFVQAVLGKLVGNRSVFKTVMPQEYHIERLRGRNAEFHIEISRIYQRNIPKIDDDFAVKLGAKDLEDLHKKIEGFIINHHEYSLKMACKSEVFDRIAKAYPFDIPPTILKTELEHYLKDQADSTKSSDVLQKNDSEDQVAKKIRMSYLLRNIANQENITVSQEDFVAAVRRDAASRGIGNVQQLMDIYASDKHLYNTMQDYIKENKIFEFIFDKISVKRTDAIHPGEVTALVQQKSAIASHTTEISA